MTQTINELMDRIKNLKEYTVTVPVPESISLNGVIPFDMTVSGKQGIFKILAASQDEANARVVDFLQSQQ